MYYTDSTAEGSRLEGPPETNVAQRPVRALVDRIHDLCDGVVDRCHELGAEASAQLQLFRPDAARLVAIESSLLRLRLGLTDATLAQLEDDLRDRPAFREIRTND